jgi:hypothetical protein
VKKLIMSRGAMFPLLLRALLGIQLVAAAELLGSQKGNGTVPSVAAIAGCKTSCGDLTFRYPFGFGADCFRGPDFALTCNQSAHQPPMLLLRDGITQVISNIIDNAIGGTLRINIQSTIPVNYDGANVYNMSWTSPGNSFELGGVWLNVTGCGFDIYFTNLDVGVTYLYCTLTCPTRDITDMVARQNCNGTGCCTIYASTPIQSFHLRFVRHGESNPEAPAPYNRSSLWDYINVTTIYADLSWTIVDQPNCASAKKNNTNFACAGNNTQCIDSSESQYLGYSCYCSPGYIGNPYLLDGCYRDTTGTVPSSLITRVILSKTFLSLIKFIEKCSKIYNLELVSLDIPIVGLNGHLVRLSSK